MTGNGGEQCMVTSPDGSMDWPTSHCEFDRDYWSTLEDLQLHHHQKIEHSKGQSGDHQSDQWQVRSIGKELTFIGGIICLLLKIMLL